MLEPLVASKYFKTYNLVVQPGQSIGPFNVPRGYWIGLENIQPSYGLGFINISIDNGPWFSVSYLPFVGEFEYFSLQNTHPNQAFRVSLLVIVNPKAQFLGYFNPVYLFYNTEITITQQFSISAAGSYNYGPFYIGTREVVIVYVTASTLQGVAYINLFDTDNTGQTVYASWIVGELVPGNTQGLGANNSVTLSLDGRLVTPYFTIQIITTGSYTVSGSITIQAR